MRRVHRQPNHAVAAVVDIQLQRFHLLGLHGVGIFLLVLGLFGFLFLTLLGLFLLGFAGFLPSCVLFLGHLELLIGVEVEEHDVGVALRTPRTVAAVARPVALEDHGLAAEHPFGVAIAITAVGQIADFALSIGRNQGHVAMVPTAVTDVAGQQPTAVGTP